MHAKVGHFSFLAFAFPSSRGVAFFPIFTPFLFCASPTSREERERHTHTTHRAVQKRKTVGVHASRICTYKRRKRERERERERETPCTGCCASTLEGEEKKVLHYKKGQSRTQTENHPCRHTRSSCWARNFPPHRTVARRPLPPPRGD